MRLLLRAITPRTEAAAAGLVRIDQGELSAWASAAASDTFTREDLLQHHRLISVLFDRETAILPARFPSVLEDADQLRERLRARHDALVAQLNHVRGCCEFAVTVVWASGEQTRPTAHVETPGWRYMLERQAALAGSDKQRQRGHELSEWVEHSVGEDLIEARHRVCPSAPIALSSAVLVRRASANHVRARLVQSEHDVRILVNGPWPPYTFAAVGSD